MSTLYESKLRGLTVFVSLTLSACSAAGFRSNVQDSQRAAASEDADARPLVVDKAAEIHSEVGSLPSKEKQVQAISQSFKVAESKEGKMALQAGGSLTREFDLTAVYLDERKTFTQLTRATESRTFRQGSTAYSDRLEEFDQSALGVLDLQLVVDNSRSMKPYQDLLAPKLQPLLKSLKNTDWQINVVTTDPADPCSRALIRKGDANADAAFAAAVTPGTAGDDVEQGIRTARMGLACSNNWLRKNSSIAVFIVGDEDNCNYNGNGCPGKPWGTYTYLTDYIANTLGRTLGKEARIYGVIRVPTSTCPDAPRSPQFEAAISATGGRYGAICAKDFTPTLEAISADMSTILKKEFMLAQMPSPGTLQVRVNGVLQAASAYTLTGQLVRFNDSAKPPFGAKISVSYKVATPAPISSRFTLGEIPLAGSTVVLINGALVNPGLYAIDAATTQIVFNSPPPEGAEIRVSFKKNITLPSSFTLDSRLITNTLQVRVNGVLSAGYTVINGALIFPAPPAEGAALDVSYRLRVGSVLDYPLALQGSVIDFQGLFDKASGTRLDATYAMGRVTVAAASYTEGRRVVARYKNESSGLFEVELPQTPIEGSLKLASSTGSCSSQVKEMLVMLACSGAENAKIDLVWNYYTPKLQSFTMQGIEKPDAGKWEVFVNGEAVDASAYVREGSTITMNDELDYLDKVMITYTLAEAN